jgi:hypothetical protein
MALTNDDFKKIKLLLNMELQNGIRKIVTEELEVRIKHLPTKEEFYTREDELMGELKAIREELTALSFRVSEHQNDIDMLKKIHPHGRHVTS